MSISDITIPQPRGFHSSCELLNILSHSIAKDMITDAFSGSHHQALAPVFVGMCASDSKQSNDPTLAFTLPQIKGILSSLHHIYTILVTNNNNIIYTSDILKTVLQRDTVFLQHIIDIIIEQYTNITSTKKSSKNQLMLSIGRLVDIQWRVGIGIASNQCDTLNTPFITLLFTISGVDGLHSYPLELTVTEFNAFRLALDDIKIQLKEAI